MVMVEIKEILDAFQRIFQAQVEKPVRSLTKYPESRKMPPGETQKLLSWLKSALTNPANAEEELRDILGVNQ